MAARSQADSACAFRLFMPAADKRLFAIEGVERVFFGTDFVTVTKAAELIDEAIRERVQTLKEVATQADIFFLKELHPYDPAELIPQKVR